MREPFHRNGHEAAIAVTQSPRPDPERPAASLADLIIEAEKAHASLGEARSALARLIGGLRRHRKQSRLVSDTLRSLRQLKLAEAVD